VTVLTCTDMPDFVKDLRDIKECSGAVEIKEIEIRHLDISYTAVA
jgi:hypothetical protein